MTATLFTGSLTDFFKGEIAWDALLLDIMIKLAVLGFPRNYTKQVM